MFTLGADLNQRAIPFLRCAKGSTNGFGGIFIKEKAYEILQVVVEGFPVYFHV